MLKKIYSNHGKSAIKVIENFLKTDILYLIFNFFFIFCNNYIDFLFTMLNLVNIH